MDINGVINIRNYIFILTLILPLYLMQVWVAFKLPSNGDVIAPTLIDEQGIYSLAISVEFIRGPYDRGDTR